MFGILILGKLFPEIKLKYKIKAAQSMDGQLYFKKSFNVGDCFAEPRNDKRYYAPTCFL